MGNDQLLQALREADAAAAGRPLTTARYSIWRDEEAARDPTRLHVLPSVATIHQRFGAWIVAVERMRDSTGNQ